MKKNLRKVLATGLAATMVMSMSMVAFADTSDGVLASDPIEFKFGKTYVTSESTKPVVYPAEKLQFKVSVPEGATNPAETMITIADHTVIGNPDNITVTVPAYSKVGVYEYTITEQEGNTQGVKYSQQPFNVKVVATYNNEHTKIETQVIFTTPDGNEGKIESFENIYDLGDLDISKTVTGNLASTTKDFEVDVTFTATAEVKSDITYVDSGKENTIEASKLEDGTETVTITVKDGETVSFNNIPYGVKYVVKEKDVYATEKDNPNSENGYDDAKYYVNAEKTTDIIKEATEAENGVEVIADSTGKKNEDTLIVKDTVDIVNKKGADVSTGISLDSMPYLMTLALSAFGALGFVSKKRKEEDEI